MNMTSRSAGIAFAFGRYFVTAVGVLLLSGCGGPRVFVQADAVPGNEPLSRQGNPESYVALGKRYFVMSNSRGYVERGIASWYGKKFHGRTTSSGERYDMYAMTAAHKTLPLPTYVRVTNLSNGRSVVVRVNDRGPFHPNRIIDLSYAAAQKLDMLRSGTALVEVRAVGGERPTPVVAAAGDKADGAVSGDWRDQSHLRNRIYVQVGAFTSRQNADQLLNRLLQARFTSVQILNFEEQEKRLHRVRIGPLDTVSATDDVVARLAGMGFSEYQVVIE
jgi:rare lipoprotein A